MAWNIEFELSSSSAGAHGNLGDGPEACYNQESG